MRRRGEKRGDSNESNLATLDALVLAELVEGCSWGKLAVNNAFGRAFVATLAPVVQCRACVRTWGWGLRC